MSTSASSAVSPTNSNFLNPRAAYTTSPSSYHTVPSGPSYPSNADPLPSNALIAEADAPLNLGLDEEEVVWKGESVGLGFGLLGRLKDKTNVLLEEIDWDCKICGKTSTDPCVTRCGHLFCWSHLTKHISQLPYCPTCSAPLTIDRDVVQVFGRPKVLPSDAPWTSASQTPASRGSAVSQNSIPNPHDTFSRSSALSLESESFENSALNLPPPPASPAGSRSRSTGPLRSRSQNDLRLPNKNDLFNQQPKRRPKPLNTISSLPPPNVLVTDESPINPHGEVSLNDLEAKEEDPWASWQRMSTSVSDPATAIPSSSATRRHSKNTIFTRSIGESLRPPSPQLRTRPFRPGWTCQRREDSNASTDSFDQHIRQTIEVKFQRGINASLGEEENSDADADGEEQGALYLNSPTVKKEVKEALPILSPVPKYGWKKRIEIAPSTPSVPPAEPSAPISSAAEQQLRREGRQWYNELTQRHFAPVQSDGPSQSSEEKKQKEFEHLKVAMKEKGKNDSGIMPVDPIGRALCVFAVVLFLKILLK